MRRDNTKQRPLAYFACNYLLDGPGWPPEVETNGMNEATDSTMEDALPKSLKPKDHHQTLSKLGRIEANQLPTTEACDNVRTLSNLERFNINHT
jgi:hypothetical protein